MLRQSQRVLDLESYPVEPSWNFFNENWLDFVTSCSHHSTYHSRKIFKSRFIREFHRCRCIANLRDFKETQYVGNHHWNNAKWRSHNTDNWFMRLVYRRCVIDASVLAHILKQHFDDGKRQQMVIISDVNWWWLRLWLWDDNSWALACSQKFLGLASELSWSR